MSPGSRTRASAPRLALRGRRAVVRRELRALAEEELLGLLVQDLVGARIARREPVLVEDHLEVLEPHLPGLLGDAFVDALAQLVRKRPEGEARQLPAELPAHHHASHSVVLSSDTGPRRP